MRTISALTAALVFAWGVPAAAADIDVKVQDGNTRTAIITFKGLIGDGESYYFKTVTEEIDNAVVVLEGPGGSMRDSIRIGQIIRAKKFSTAVPDHALCASGCALIWLGGTTRFMGRGARIGFHSSATFKKRSDIANANGIMPYIMQLDYPLELYSYIVRAAPQSMTWLTKQDSERYAIGATPLGEFEALHLNRSRESSDAVSVSR